MECGAWNVECGVWSVECGVWGVGCGVWGVGMGDQGLGRRRGMRESSEALWQKLNPKPCREREFFIDKLRIYLVIEIISVDRPCAMGV